MTPAKHHAALLRSAPSADLRRLAVLLSDGRLSDHLEAVRLLSTDRERLLSDADPDDLSNPRVWAARVAYLAGVGHEAIAETLTRFVRLAFLAGLVVGALLTTTIAAVLCR